MSSKITLRGNPVTVDGNLPTRGNQAPGLKLTNAALADVSLADYGGKRKVLNIVPSLDTPNCATSTRKFNASASSLANTVALVVSADLPFAAKFLRTGMISQRRPSDDLPPSGIPRGLWRRPGRRAAGGADGAGRGGP